MLDDYVDEKHILRVKYEDIVADTSKELAKICGFLGLAFEDGMLDFAAKSHHSTNGNNMRFRKTSEIRIDTAWIDELYEADRMYFELRAGKLNRQLGYE